MNTHFTIGQLAKVVGLPPKTIRYYEAIQLLHPAMRAKNNYRVYSRGDVVRLSLIKHGRALGLPLDEVKHLVSEGLDGSCQELKESLLLTLPQYVQAVTERVAELRHFQHDLQTLQKNLTALHLNKPTEKVASKDCCEVLEQMATTTTKGGGGNGAQKR